MGTINKAIADKIINGTDFVDETQYVVTYNNMFDGGLEYATIGWREDPLRYHASPACFNVEVVWSHPKSTRHPTC
jgi:hypothetical protein